MNIIPHKKDKGFKTTVVAYICLLLIVVCFVSLFMGIINGGELQQLITGIVAGAVVMIGLFAKDGDKTGTNEINNESS